MTKDENWVDWQRKLVARLEQAGFSGEWGLDQDLVTIWTGACRAVTVWIQDGVAWTSAGGRWTDRQASARVARTIRQKI